MRRFELGLCVTIVLTLAPPAMGQRVQQPRNLVCESKSDEPIGMTLADMPFRNLHARLKITGLPDQAFVFAVVQQAPKANRNLAFKLDQVVLPRSAEHKPDAMMLLTFHIGEYDNGAILGRDSKQGMIITKTGMLDLTLTRLPSGEVEMRVFNPPLDPKSPDVRTVGLKAAPLPDGIVGMQCQAGRVEVSGLTIE